MKTKTKIRKANRIWIEKKEKSNNNINEKVKKKYIKHLQTSINASK